jgi:colanic acid biosynthesis glycosyl transferase WcaI
MNLLVVSINYTPEPTGFAPHTAALCEYLASRNHFVKVITGFPFAPYWARWREYRGKFIKYERIKGVQILRLTHYIPRHPRRHFERFLMEGSYCLLAAFVAFLDIRSRWDLILYVGAQPSIAMLARFIGFYRGIPYVVKITDLATQAAVDVGIIRAPWLKKVLVKFEYSAYRYASGVIVLCPSFQSALIANHYSTERIRVIPNSEDLDLIRPMPSDQTFRREHHLSPDDFVVLSCGSMGIKQGLTNVVEAARMLKNECPEIKWVLVGDGELKQTLVSLIAKYSLNTQVGLLPLQPESRMAMMFSSADVLLLNQLGTVKDTVIPGKLQTYMVAGRAILAAVNPTSQAAELIRESKSGIIVPPEDPTALSNAVREMKTDSKKLKDMGQRSRLYAEKHFDRKQILAAQEAFLLEVIKKAK